MLCHSGGDQQEEQVSGLRVDGAVRYALVVPAKNDDRLFDEADERVASMGQGDTIANSGAVELLAFLQRAEQSELGLGARGDFRDPADQFMQHVVPLTATQTKVDGGGGNELANQKAF
jgi:hypothetical protein